MSIVKMFAALLITAGVMQTLAMQAKAETLPKLESSRRAEAGCGWKHPYRYQYHYSLRRPSPYQHPHAPHVRRKPNPND